MSDLRDTGVRTLTALQRTSTLQLFKSCVPIFTSRIVHYEGLPNKLPLLHQKSSHVHYIRTVDLKQPDRRAPHCGEGFQESIVPSKVRFPDVLPRMKYRRNVARHGVDAGQIRAFVSIAITAGESDIAFNSSSAMLLSDYVIEMEREFRKGFGKPAVLATVARSRPNEFLQSFPVATRSQGCRLKDSRALAFNNSKARPTLR